MRESLVPDLLVSTSTNHIFSSNLSKTPVQGSETLAELETKQKIKTVAEARTRVLSMYLRATPPKSYKFS